MTGRPLLGGPQPGHGKLEQRSILAPGQIDVVRFPRPEDEIDRSFRLLGPLGSRVPASLIEPVPHLSHVELHSRRAGQVASSLCRERVRKLTCLRNTAGPEVGAGEALFDAGLVAFRTGLRTNISGIDIRLLSERIGGDNRAFGIRLSPPRRPALPAQPHQHHQTHHEGQPLEESGLHRPCGRVCGRRQVGSHLGSDLAKGAC